MNYFVTNGERRGTCYHEFSKGKWDGSSVWRNSSLYLRDDHFGDLRLYELIFKPVFEEFDRKFTRWGDNEVDKALWESLVVRSVEIGGEAAEVFMEISPWVEKNFEEHEVFTILGM